MEHRGSLRELLTAAFSDAELTTLCFDHFHPVYEDFAAGMSKGDKIQRLLDYCIRHEQVTDFAGHGGEGQPRAVPTVCGQPARMTDSTTNLPD